MPILITEDVTGTQATIVHQLHEGWETAIGTIRQSYCNCKNLRIKEGERKLFKGQMRQAVRVECSGNPYRADFLLTEMFLYNVVDHL